ncbi:hypothetical protein DH2020_044022 [Rehmannia glutinosa]|uniref:Endonuclease/exonuclease/phosphatase domain-containing protein n=1 Tax=Rehmannia glutinosa TaxID=99300 RepID=A0ABR0UIV8_REHGL
MEFSTSILPSKFYASLVYAKSTRVERRGLWDDLRFFASTYTSLPWLVGGDFNCFLHSDERVGSNSNRVLDMEEFNQLVSDCGLVDIGFEGPHMHTWVRNNLRERLDRIFLNNRWADVFAISSVKHLPRIHSDHAPILFKAAVSGSKPASAFRYFKMWARYPTFISNIAKVWSAPTGFPSLVNLHHKLIRVKQRLKWWNKHMFGDIFSNLKNAGAKVASAESNFDFNPSPEHRALLHQAIAELVLATKIEEDYWHQKSACKWIVEGGRNTHYFHNLVKQKRLKARIHSITDNGVTLTSDSDIQQSWEATLDIGPYRPL